MSVFNLEEYISHVYRNIWNDIYNHIQDVLFFTRAEFYPVNLSTGRFLLSVVRSYAPGCEPLVTGNLAIGLTIRSSHKQELSSVYQFIDVLYSLCIYEALRH